MSQDKKFTLGNAIKLFYTVKPLEKDLATLVADKVFMKQETTSFNWDNLLYYLICIICTGAITYMLSVVKFVSLAPVLLSTIVILIVIVLAVKEFKVLNEKILALK